MLRVHAFADRWDAMSEEEKEELARVGEHQLAELGQQPDPAAPEGVRSDDDDFDIDIDPPHRLVTIPTPRTGKGMQGTGDALVRRPQVASSTGTTRSPTVPRGRHRRRVIRQPAAVRNHVSS